MTTRDPNKRILINDGSGIDKFRTIHGTAEARNVLQNELNRQRDNHKGGQKRRAKRGTCSVCDTEIIQKPDGKWHHRRSPSRGHRIKVKNA